MERARTGLTKPVVKKTPEITTFFAEKTSFDDLIYAKYMILLVRKKKLRNIFKSRRLSSFFL